MASRVGNFHVDERTGMSTPWRADDGPRTYDFGAVVPGLEDSGVLTLDDDVAQRLVRKDPLLKIIGMDRAIPSKVTVVFRSPNGRYDSLQNARVQKMDSIPYYFWEGMDPWTESRDRVQWMIDRLSGDPGCAFEFPDLSQHRGAVPAEPEVELDPWNGLKKLARGLGLSVAPTVNRQQLMGMVYAKDPVAASVYFDRVGYRWRLEQGGAFNPDPPVEEDLEALAREVPTGTLARRQRAAELTAGAGA